MSKFNVGDDVYDLRYGNGTVIEIYYGDRWGVVAKFRDGKESIIENYAHGGEAYVHWVNPMLYHGHDLNVVVKQKQYEYQVIYKIAGRELWHTSAEFYTDINVWRDAVLCSGEEAEAVFLEVSKREVNDD